MGWIDSRPGVDWSRFVGHIVGLHAPIPAEKAGSGSRGIVSSVRGNPGGCHRVRDLLFRCRRHTPRNAPVNRAFCLEAPDKSLYHQGTLGRTGFMKKEYHSWHSPILGMTMPIVCYGHFGKPL